MSQRLSGSSRASRASRSPRAPLPRSDGSPRELWAREGPVLLDAASRRPGAGGRGSGGGGSGGGVGGRGGGGAVVTDGADRRGRIGGGGGNTYVTIEVQKSRGGKGEAKGPVDRAGDGGEVADPANTPECYVFPPGRPRVTYREGVVGDVGAWPPQPYPARPWTRAMGRPFPWTSSYPIPPGTPGFAYPIPGQYPCRPPNRIPQQPPPRPVPAYWGQRMASSPWRGAMATVDQPYPAPYQPPPFPPMPPFPSDVGPAPPTPCDGAQRLAGAGRPLNEPFALSSLCPCSPPCPDGSSAPSECSCPCDDSTPDGPTGVNALPSPASPPCPCDETLPLPFSNAPPLPAAPLYPAFPTTPPSAPYTSPVTSSTPAPSCPVSLPFTSPTGALGQLCPTEMTYTVMTSTAGLPRPTGVNFMNPASVPFSTDGGVTSPTAETLPGAMSSPASPPGEGVPCDTAATEELLDQMARAARDLPDELCREEKASLMRRVRQLREARGAGVPSRGPRSRSKVTICESAQAASASKPWGSVQQLAQLPCPAFTDIPPAEPCLGFQTPVPETEEQLDFCDCTPSVESPAPPAGPTPVSQNSSDIQPKSQAPEDLEYGPSQMVPAEAPMKDTVSAGVYGVGKSEDPADTTAASGSESTQPSTNMPDSNSLREACNVMNIILDKVATIAPDILPSRPSSNVPDWNALKESCIILKSILEKVTSIGLEAIAPPTTVVQQSSALRDSCSLLKNILEKATVVGVEALSSHNEVKTLSSCSLQSTCAILTGILDRVVLCSRETQSLPASTGGLSTDTNMISQPSTALSDSRDGTETQSPSVSPDTDAVTNTTENASGALVPTQTEGSTQQDINVPHLDSLFQEFPISQQCQEQSSQPCNEGQSSPASSTFTPMTPFPRLSQTLGPCIKIPLGPIERPSSDAPSQNSDACANTTPCPGDTPGESDPKPPPDQPCPSKQPCSEDSALLTVFKRSGDFIQSSSTTSEAECSRLTSTEPCSKLARDVCLRAPRRGSPVEHEVSQQTSGARVADSKSLKGTSGGQTVPYRETDRSSPTHRRGAYKPPHSLRYCTFTLDTQKGRTHTSVKSTGNQTEASIACQTETTKCVLYRKSPHARISSEPGSFVPRESYNRRGVYVGTSDAFTSTSNAECSRTRRYTPSPPRRVQRANASTATADAPAVSTSSRIPVSTSPLRRASHDSSHASQIAGPGRSEHTRWSQPLRGRASPTKATPKPGGAAPLPNMSSTRMASSPWSTSSCDVGVSTEISGESCNAFARPCGDCNERNATNSPSWTRQPIFSASNMPMLCMPMPIPVPVTLTCPCSRYARYPPPRAGHQDNVSAAPCDLQRKRAPRPRSRAKNTSQAEPESGRSERADSPPNDSQTSENIPRGRDMPPQQLSQMIRDTLSKSKAAQYIQRLVEESKAIAKTEEHDPQTASDANVSGHVEEVNTNNVGGDSRESNQDEENSNGERPPRPLEQALVGNEETRRQETNENDSYDVTERKALTHDASLQDTETQLSESKNIPPFIPTVKQRLNVLYRNEPVSKSGANHDTIDNEEGSDTLLRAAQLHVQEVMCEETQPLCIFLPRLSDDTDDGTEEEAHLLSSALDSEIEEFERSVEAREEILVNVDLEKELEQQEEHANEVDSSPQVVAQNPNKVSKSGKSKRSRRKLSPASYSRRGTHDNKSKNNSSGQSVNPPAAWSNPSLTISQYISQNVPGDMLPLIVHSTPEACPATAATSPPATRPHVSSPELASVPGYSVQTPRVFITPRGTPPSRRVHGDMSSAREEARNWLRLTRTGRDALTRAVREHQEQRHEKIGETEESTERLETTTFTDASGVFDPQTFCLNVPLRTTKVGAIPMRALYRPPIHGAQLTSQSGPYPEDVSSSRPSAGSRPEHTSFLTPGTVLLGGRALSPSGRTSLGGQGYSQLGRTSSPTGRGTSPSAHTAFSVGRATSPSTQTVSSGGRATAPVKRATSPLTIATTSQAPSVSSSPHFSPSLERAVLHSEIATSHLARAIQMSEAPRRSGGRACPVYRQPIRAPPKADAQQSGYQHQTALAQHQRTDVASRKQKPPAQQSRPARMPGQHVVGSSPDVRMRRSQSDKSRLSLAQDAGKEPCKSRERPRPITQQQRSGTDVDLRTPARKQRGSFRSNAADRGRQRQRAASEATPTPRDAKASTGAVQRRGQRQPLSGPTGTPRPPPLPPTESPPPSSPLLTPSHPHSPVPKIPSEPSLPASPAPRHSAPPPAPLPPSPTPSSLPSSSSSSSPSSSLSSTPSATSPSSSFSPSDFGQSMSAASRAAKDVPAYKMLMDIMNSAQDTRTLFITGASLRTLSHCQIPAADDRSSPWTMTTDAGDADDEDKDDVVDEEEEEEGEQEKRKEKPKNGQRGGAIGGRDASDATIAAVPSSSAVGRRSVRAARWGVQPSRSLPVESASGDARAADDLAPSRTYSASSASSSTSTHALGAPAGPLPPARAGGVGRKRYSADDLCVRPVRAFGRDGPARALLMPPAQRARRILTLPRTRSVLRAFKTVAKAVASA